MSLKKIAGAALLLTSVLLILLFAAYGTPDAKGNGAAEQLQETNSPAPNNPSETYDEADQAINVGNAVITENAAVKSDGALIVFTFDDGNVSDYSLAFPILTEYGITGTSYINPYDPDHETVNKLSWSQIREMYAQGWDFEDHTYSHINLTKSTPEQIKQSMEQVNAAFLENGLKPPVAFAYPYGKFDQDAVAIVRQYRSQARLAYYRDDFVDLKSADFYQIPCVSADMQTEKRLKEKENLVDKACSKNGVIVFRVHCLYRNALDDMGVEVVQTSSALFEELVRYCVNKGCSFTTMDKLVDDYANP